MNNYNIKLITHHSSLITLLFTAYCLLFTACNSGVNVDDIPVAIEVQRFDKDLQAAAEDTLALSVLRERYGDFFEYYNTGLIGIGNSHSPLYQTILSEFMNSHVVKIAYREVQQVFPDEKALNVALTGGFKHLKYYFPDMVIPEVYAYVSGFNEAIMLTDSVIGVGLDRFLSDTCSLYGQLDIPRYQQYNMRPARIPTECLQAWVRSEYYVETGDESTLLQEMIYGGKISYVNELCFPQAADTLLLGYTTQQLNWCKENEAFMWTYLLENRELYNTNQFTIHKYVSDAPYTSYFAQESPGKSVLWLGYRIVEAYMKRHNITLPELMQLDAQTILKESRYNP